MKVVHHHFDRYHLHNVIVFGKTGAGKSSVINMLLGTRPQEATVSYSSRGETFDHREYRLQHHGDHYILHDTPGFNEDLTTPSKDAVQTLYDLAAHLEGGVHLLLYVVRGPRIEESPLRNYQLFKESLCRGKVPICLIVTGLENEDSPEQWWTDNKGNFDKLDMVFDNHACITATKGKKMKNGAHPFAETYEDSTKAVEKLLEHCLLRGWGMPRETPFVATINRLWNFFAQAFGGQRRGYLHELTQRLVDYGLAPDNASKIVDNIGEPGAA